MLSCTVSDSTSVHMQCAMFSRQFSTISTITVGDKLIKHQNVDHRSRTLPQRLRPMINIDPAFFSDIEPLCFFGQREDKIERKHCNVMSVCLESTLSWHRLFPGVAWMFRRRRRRWLNIQATPNILATPDRRTSQNVGPCDVCIDVGSPGGSTPCSLLSQKKLYVLTLYRPSIHPLGPHIYSCDVYAHTVHVYTQWRWSRAETIP